MSTDGLLNAKEAAARLNVPLSTFHLYRKDGKFTDLLAVRPVGRKKYSAALVAARASSRSTVRFGKKARTR